MRARKVILARGLDRIDHFSSIFFFQTESNSREREKSRNEEGEYSIRYQVLDDKAALTEKKNSNGTNLLELFFLVVENREEEPERISR